jgi:hypothetical protein
MSSYTANAQKLDGTINRLEPFFRAQYGRIHGTSIMKVINREQHETAHLIIDSPKRSYARVTTAVTREHVGLENDREPLFDYHVKLPILGDHRYRILSTCETLFIVVDEQTEFDSPRTNVYEVDPQPIVAWMDKVFKDMPSFDYPTIGGFYLMPIGETQTIREDGRPVASLLTLKAIRNKFTIDWASYRFYDKNNVVLPLLSSSIKRAWGNYRLAMQPPKNRVLAVCRETKEYRQYESQHEAALDLVAINKNEDTAQGRKIVSNACAYISNSVLGKVRKVHGTDGHWWAFFDYDEAKALENAGTLKDAIAARFAPVSRKKRATA